MALPPQLAFQGGMFLAEWCHENSKKALATCGLVGILVFGIPYVKEKIAEHDTRVLANYMFSGIESMALPPEYGGMKRK